MTEGTGAVRLTAADGLGIVVTDFSESPQPRAVIQVLHGMGEYSGRYARFARAASERGIGTAGHDHRGHGPEATIRNWFAPRDGWDRLIDDARVVNDWIAATYPGVPQVLLGHSMGSFVAQGFAMRYGDRLGALILSGSNWPSRTQVFAAHLLARLECRRLGDRAVSPLLEKLGFEAFNRRFSPTRTTHDWLSRDDAEVDRYLDDPLSGGPFTAGLWRDLTDGLLRIGTDAALSRVPAGLPILISGGAADPVGGDKGMGNLAMHYAQTGHSRIKVRIYPDGRHEMLNELNRDEVTRDWLDWIEQVLPL